jgi:hypothetical protein
MTISITSFGQVRVDFVFRDVCVVTLRWSFALERSPTLIFFRWGIVSDWSNRFGFFHL